MRNRLTAVAAGALLFMAACGGGNTTSGTSGGIGGTSGGGTTGGTTTGTALLPPGQACTADSQCASTVCGVDGTGNCCVEACSTSDSMCGATSCDGSGACVYPASGTSCGDFCGAGNNKLTPKSCDGSGTCASGMASTCPGNLACNSAGTACNTNCGDSTACASGYVCNNGACSSPRTIGPCTENDDCFSGHCGIHGMGNCCVTMDAGCLTADATCGATDCSPSNGQCNYTDAGTACGSVLASCTNDVQQNPSVCDGKGTCPAPTTVPCDAFLCGPTACLTSCTDDTSCGTGDFCDVGHKTCCEALPSGSTITVDGTAGIDDACCSVGGRPQCQTIHQVMTLIDDAKATGVTINAVVLKNHSWLPPTEVYPIVLGWGAELSAPGIFFNDPTDGGSEVIDIDNFSTNDTVGYASLVGATGKNVTVGVDEFGNQALDSSMIQVEAGNTLFIANATVNGTFEIQDGTEEFTFESTAITVKGGAGMTLGQDKSAGVTGTVTIGNTADNQLTNGWNGIVCGVANGKGCTINDATLKAGTSSVIIEGQEGTDIDAEDNAKITLTSSPVIGLAPSDAGFQTCPDKPDVQDNFNNANPSDNGAAVLLNGNASVTFNNGTVQCIAGDAFDLFATKAGAPTLTLTNTTIQNTEYGVNAFAGTATVTNSTIWYNTNGVQQGTDGTNVSSLDLSSQGGDAGTTTVVCSNSYETATGTNTPGVSVLNSTSANLDAADVDWDTKGPDLFSCDATLADCTCELSSCTLSVSDGGVDGMDAVYTAGGTITTTGNGLSTADCTAPAGGGGTCCGQPCKGICEIISDPPNPPICECIHGG